MMAMRAIILTLLEIYVIPKMNLGICRFTRQFIGLFPASYEFELENDTDRILG